MHIGELDELIISPLLTLTVSLQLPAWLTFLEPEKCRLARVLQTHPGWPRITSPTPRQQTDQNPSADLCWRGLSIFSVGTGLDGGSTLCPCAPAQAVRYIDRLLVVYLRN